jgi:hypothetical protein
VDPRDAGSHRSRPRTRRDKRGPRGYGTCNVYFGPRVFGADTVGPIGRGPLFSHSRGECRPRIVSSPLITAAATRDWRAGRGTIMTRLQAHRARRAPRTEGKFRPRFEYRPLNAFPARSPFKRIFLRRVPDSIQTNDFGMTVGLAGGHPIWDPARPSGYCRFFATQQTAVASTANNPRQGVRDSRICSKLRRPGWASGSSWAPVAHGTLATYSSPPGSY